MSYQPIVSSSALSTLSSASRSVVIKVFAGQPVLIDISKTFPGGAATRSGIGTAIRMNLQCYSECLPKSEKGSGGISVVKAVTTRSGNASVFSIARDTASSNTFENSTRGADSSGSYSITASITSQPENVLISYDPTSLAGTSTSFKDSTISYYPSATVASFAALSSVDSAIANLFSTTEDMVLLGTLDGGLSLLVTRGSSVDVNTLAPALATAPSPGSFLLSQIVPNLGLGFDPIVGVSPTYGSTVARVPLSSSTSVTDVTIAGGTSASDVKLTGYNISSDMAVDSLILDELFSVFFDTDTASIIAAISPVVSSVKTVAAATVKVTPPSIDLVFNGSLVSGAPGFDGGIQIG